MKAVLFSVLMIAGTSAMAESDWNVLDMINVAPQATTSQGCKEGATMIFPNNGTCGFGGGSLTTTEKCINGKYVVVASTCNRD